MDRRFSRSVRTRCRMQATREQGRMRTRGARTPRSLFGFVLRIVIVLGVDGERLLGDLGLFEDFLGDRRLLLYLFGVFLDLFAGVAEERAAHIRPLLRLGGAVVTGERDPACVLGAREHLADG